MKPLISAIMTENQHRAGRVADLGGLPAVSCDGICTLDIGGSAFSFAHPRDPSWQTSGASHLWTWPDLRKPAWLPAWMNDNALGEWFDDTDLPEGAQAVWLQGDLEALADCAEEVLGQKPIDPSYTPVVGAALPLIYATVQCLAAEAWGVPVLVGHTNHVRQAPYAGVGPYISETMTYSKRALSMRLGPVGGFIPVKAFWKHERKHSQWSVEDCARHVARSISTAHSVSDGLPVVLNIGVHNHGDAGLIRDVELAGSLLAAESTPVVVGARVWGSADLLERRVGEDWPAQVEGLVARARELVAERGASPEVNAAN